MVKSLLKKQLIILIVFSMCIANKAAIVGDNDGSAFVTKEEFDALKSNFNEQIDNYNNSISSKVDGAIAAYLAGINMKKEQIQLIVSDWEGVTEFNGALKNNYDYPNVDGNVVICQKIIEHNLPISQLHDTSTMTDSNDWWKMIWCMARTSYTNANPSSTRNLVGNVIISSTPDTTNMVWKGRANCVKETWTLSIVRTYTNNPSGMVTDSTINIFSICEYLNLIRTGYINSFIDVSNPIWKPSIRWRSSGNVYFNWGYGTTFAVSAIPTISYEKDSEGKTKSYEHIITHKSTDSWEICAEDVTNYLSFSTNNNCKTAAWTALTTNSGIWNGSEFAFYKSTAPMTRNIGLNALQVDKDVTWTDDTYTGTANNKQIPVIGLIGNATAGSIYQFDNNDLKDLDGTSVTKLKLHEGLPIMKVKAEETIEWEPEFKNIKVDGVTGVDECKIKLSYVPFTNEGTVSDNKDLVKMDGIALNGWAKTTEGKVKITFETDRSGYVYAKWVPDTTDSNISNKDWEVTLDISKCKIYFSS